MATALPVSTLSTSQNLSQIPGTNGGTIQDLQRAVNQLPDDEESLKVKSMVNTLLQTGGVVELCVKIHNANKCHEGLKNLVKLEKIIANKEIVSEETVSKLTKEANIPLLGKLKQKIIALCTGGKCAADEAQEIARQNLRNEVTGKLAAARKELAEATIKNNAWTSGVVLIVQFIKLYIVFGTIKEAQNLTREAKVELGHISSLMAELRKDVEFIQAEMSKGDAAVVKQVEINSRRAHRKLNTITTLLADVKLKVGSKIERLAATQDTLVLDGIANLAQGVVNSYQYFTFAGLLSPGLKMLQGSISALFIFATGGSVALFYLNGNALNAIREEMLNIRELSLQKDELGKMIEEADEWLLVH